MKKKDVIDYALGYIYRYPKTEKELVVKLREKKYSEEEIKKAVDFLKRKWWIDDRKIAQLYIESELIKKGKPLIVVRNKLISKWIDKTIVDKLLEEYKNQIDSWISERIKKEIKKYKSKWLNGFEIVQKLIMKWYKISDIRKLLD